MAKKYHFDKVAKQVKHRRQAAAQSQNTQLQMENDHLKMQHKLLKTQIQVTKAKQGGTTSGTKKK